MEKTNLKKNERFYTLQNYLDKEERALHKHEFHNGEIIRLPSRKANLNLLVTNVGAALKHSSRHLPKKCLVFGSDLKTYIETIDKVLYPDAQIIHEIAECWKDREDLVLNPFLIAQVLSEKQPYSRFHLYETLPMLTEYLLIKEHTPSVSAWFRISANNWHRLTETDLTKSILLRSLGVSIPLADIYENIDFKK